MKINQLTQTQKLNPFSPIKPIRPLVSLEKIDVSFNDQKALQNINLSIYPNSITTIVGPNGGGKSTLLKVLLKLITPNKGKVFHQKDLKIGYVPQKLHLDPSMPITVTHFLALKPNTDKKMIEEALSLFSITHLAQNSMQKLSGGELQRVLLARAVLNRPQLLVLDEPMQGVDITGQTELYQLLNKTRALLNCAILMVSHDLNIVMANTDEVLCVNKHICCAGTPEVITNDPSFIHFFGDQFARNVAFYSHNHNHHHNLHGDICPEQCNCKHTPR
ncbi:zinc transporter [Mannheimia granulomatis]|uniref:Leukotoxin translocation ATP-binding protein LktB n=1 Tax=Mannheimia granulomatis TaxID=85402 RepID=A0A011NCD7_9PAST|nr:zinc ABC transporter ATP-binding protein ZnuC [Mannheimia granulomatis]EXI62035.1 zinc transporter [Mannheimia granulomatis]RGE49133.1 zinc transporter [Mannheimia granulomatis]